MQDECGSNILTEFCGLRSKLYSLRIKGQSQVKKAKGVKSSVVKNTIDFEDYISCLRNNSSISREQMNIRSVHHRIRTEKMRKVALSAHDDKRYLVLGQTDTLPHGHFSIIDDEMIHAVMESEVEEAGENLNEGRRGSYEEIDDEMIHAVMKVEAEEAGKNLNEGKRCSYEEIDDEMIHAVMEVEAEEARENLNGKRRDIHKESVNLMEGTVLYQEERKRSAASPHPEESTAKRFQASDKQ